LGEEKAFAILTEFRGLPRLRRRKGGGLFDIVKKKCSWTAIYRRVRPKGRPVVDCRSSSRSVVGVGPLHRPGVTD